MAENLVDMNSRASVEAKAVKSYQQFVENGGDIGQVLRSRGLPTPNISNVDMKYGVTAAEVSDYNKTMTNKLTSIFQSVGEIKNHQQQKSSETMNDIESLKRRLNSDKLSVEEQEQCEQYMWALIAKARMESFNEMNHMRDALYRLSEMKILLSEKLLQASEEDKTSIEVTGTSGATSRATGYGGALKQALEHYALAIPIFVGRPMERAPPLCGCVPAGKKYVARVMDKVAAQVTMQTSESSAVQSEDGSSSTDSPMELEEQWILAEIVSYDIHNKAYHVKDVYPEERIKRRYIVERRKVIPLPKMATNPEMNSDALFPVDSRILALYPQTTCFYPGYVSEAPGKYDEAYTIVFDDKTYKSGFAPPMAVSQAFVLRHPPQMT